MHQAFIPVERGKSIDARLYDLLTTPTPSGKEGNILKLMPEGYFKDGNGNLIYYIGKTSEHKTMFSSHMDTVHRSEEPLILLEGVDKGTKTASGVIYAALRSTGNASVLGADDRVGMYIMLRMMEAKIPGMYVFHVQEEIGRKGSIALLKEKPSFFNGIERCIAFDRRGYTSVITYQSGHRCCSDDFANAVSKALNEHMKLPKSAFVPDDTGSYTDSATYMSVIPECTNISVGYNNEHSANECFDLWWLEKKFIPALLTVEWTKLPVKRDPKKKESKYTTYSSYGYGKGVKSYGYGSYQGKTNLTDWSNYTATTNWDQLPYWNMSDGIPKNASEAAVKNAIMKKFAMSPTGFCFEAFKVLSELERAKFDLDALTKMLEKTEAENKMLWKELEVFYNGGYPNLN